MVNIIFVFLVLAYVCLPYHIDCWLSSPDKENFLMMKKRGYFWTISNGVFLGIEVLIFYICMLRNVITWGYVTATTYSLLFWMCSLNSLSLIASVWSVLNLLNQRIFLFASCIERRKNLILATHRLWYVLNIAKIAKQKFSFRVKMCTGLNKFKIRKQLGCQFFPSIFYILH